MYIARTGQLVDTGKELEQKFYILDEDNNYKLVKGVALTFPQGTDQDTIDTAIAQSVKDAYEAIGGKSKQSLDELKKAAVQRIDKPVEKVEDKLSKLNGILTS